MADDEQYQNLFNEVARLKAHNLVLRKGLLEEQDSSSRLHADLKEKERKLRAALQRIDSLSFHNRSLVRKVESLQADLSRHTTSNLWFGSTALKKELLTLKESLDITSQELKSKIHENERLNNEIIALRNSQHNEVRCQQERIKELETKMSEAQEELNFTVSNYSDTVSRLRQDGLKLEAELQSVSSGLQRESDRYSAAERSRDELVDKNEILKSKNESLERELSELEARYRVQEDRILKSEQNEVKFLQEMALLKQQLEVEEKRTGELEQNLEQMALALDNSKPEIHKENSDTHGVHVVNIPCSEGDKVDLIDPEWHGQTKKYYEGKISELVEQLETANALAARRQGLLRQTTETSAQSREYSAAMNDLVEVKTREVLDLQERLATTEEKYQEQISVMTEHICKLSSDLEVLRRKDTGHGDGNEETDKAV